jgi:hypothetical protein
MAINNALFEFNTQTIGTTLYSLTNNSTSIATQTTDAIVSVWIDTTNMAAGDEFEIFLLEKVTAAGSQRTTSLAVLVGAQPGPFISSPFQLGDGWDVAMQKVSGTDRAFSWSIRGIT